MLKLQVANSELNLGLQFVKTFAEWKFETTSYCSNIFHSQILFQLKHFSHEIFENKVVSTIWESGAH